MEINAVLPWLVALLLSADRVIAVLRRMGKIPGEVNHSLDDFASARMAEQQQQARFRALVDKSDLILAELTPNGGKSLRDLAIRVEAKVGAIEGKLDAHLEEAGPLTEELHALARRVDAHLSLHLDGPLA